MKGEGWKFCANYFYLLTQIWHSFIWVKKFIILQYSKVLKQIVRELQYITFRPFLSPTTCGSKNYPPLELSLNLSGNSSQIHTFT